MIKIKNKIPLKELKNFGFEYIGEKAGDYFTPNRSHYRPHYYKTNDKEWESEKIEIYGDRIIHIYINTEYYHCWTDDDTLDTIYDLIKADMVEKIN